MREAHIMSWISRNVVVAALAGAVVALPTDAKALLIFTDAGPDVASITDTVNAYRVALGDPNNANLAGPLLSGRREINWDGGGPPLIDGTPPVTPFLVFTGTRGATFTTPGTGLSQAPDGEMGGANSLASINPTYALLFDPFSLNRLFTPIGSNITEGFFSIPNSGGNVPAAVSGFGAVFSDVDLLGPTTIQYFDTGGNLIGGVPAVPAFPGNETFSFLGIVLGSGEGLISRVLITTGNTPLGPNESSTIDPVVFDDLFYGEPQAVVGQVPQPQSLLLLGMGLMVVGGALARRARHSHRSRSDSSA
jgi:hypothetical protein